MRNVSCFKRLTNDDLLALVTLLRDPDSLVVDVDVLASSVFPGTPWVSDEGVHAQVLSLSQFSV